MCGRYTYLGNPKVVTTPLDMVSRCSKPRYNIAPGQNAVVVRKMGSQDPVMEELRWGLVPSWARRPVTEHATINARSETVALKPSFRDSFRRRRCLVLADSYFEWQTIDRHKVPWRIMMKDERAFALAGLWDKWFKGDGEVLETFTILTTEANDLTEKLHPRMPVILPMHCWKCWLNPDLQDPSGLQSLLRPFAQTGMRTYPVSTHVNSVANDTERCIQPAQTPPCQGEFCFPGDKTSL